MSHSLSTQRNTMKTISSAYVPPALRQQQKQQKKAPDVSNDKDFPALSASLHSLGIEQKIKASFAPNKISFSATVEAMAAKAQEEELMEKARQKREAEEARHQGISAAELAARRQHLATIGNRCWDDVPADYDGSDEDLDEDDAYYGEMERREMAALCGSSGFSGSSSYRGTAAHNAHDTTGEFNADLASARRRGDRGIW
jgi:hypothetical protein